MKKIISSVLVSILLTSQAFTQNGVSFKHSVDEFLYTTQVEWDQEDLNFYSQAEQKLFDHLEIALESGTDPQEIAMELIERIPDLEKQKELKILMQTQSPKDGLALLLTSHSSSMGSQGASWSPGKVLLGMVITYAILKGLMLIIYYWDSIGYEGSGDMDPPPPPKG